MRTLAALLGVLLVAVSAARADGRYDFRDTDAYRALAPADRDRLERVELDLTTLWGALDRYADEHGGNPPEGLDELVPHFLLRLPRDPFAEGGASYGYRRGAPGNRAWVVSSAGLPDFPYLAARGNVGLYRCKGTWISGINPVVGREPERQKGPQDLLDRIQRQRDITRSQDNLRTLALLLADGSIRRGWPAFSGKRFVLSVAASGLVDPRDPSNLDVFFSPGDEERSLTKATEGALQRVTEQSLQGDLDVDRLTSYAGRRNAAREWMLTPDALKKIVPILADLSFESVVIIAYSDGSVQVKTRKDLGIAPGVAITVGDDAPSELLRGLSLD